MPGKEQLRDRGHEGKWLSLLAISNKNCKGDAQQGGYWGIIFADLMDLQFTHTHTHTHTHNFPVQQLHYAFEVCIVPK